MARRAQPLTAPVDRRLLLGGGAATALVGALTLGAIAVVAARGDAPAALSAADWRAVSFTLRQALYSAALSVAFAIPLARALARRRFRGRDALIAVLGAPFLLPVIIAILGVIAVWGRSGWISVGLGALGLAPLDVYGLPGVLIAHVFFNLPLATRLLLQGYARVPGESWRLAAQLGVEGRALFRLLEWPAIRAAAPSAFALVFLLCLTSFAVALALGGGPRATTVELAIYEAATYSFDLGRAAQLATLQFAIGAAAALLALAVSAPFTAGAGLAISIRRWDGRSAGARAFDALAIAAAALFLGAPLLAATLNGVGGLAALPAATWPAAGRSVIVALASTALTLALAAPLAGLAAALARRGRHRMAGALDTLAMTPVVASPFIIGVALFLTLRSVAAPTDLALVLTAIVNSAMALPFAMRILTPALRAAARDHGRLADSLGLAGWTRLRVLYWPTLRPPLGFAAALAAALSVGDLGVIALFAAPDQPTLPLLMYALASTRRIEAASAAALLLAALAFGLYALFDRLGGRAR